MSGLISHSEVFPQSTLEKSNIDYIKQQYQVKCENLLIVIDSEQESLRKQFQSKLKLNQEEEGQAHENGEGKINDYGVQLHSDGSQIGNTGEQVNNSNGDEMDLEQKVTIMNQLLGQNASPSQEGGEYYQTFKYQRYEISQDCYDSQKAIESALDFIR